MRANARDREPEAIVLTLSSVDAACLLGGGSADASYVVPLDYLPPVLALSVVPVAPLGAFPSADAAAVLVGLALAVDREGNVEAVRVVRSGGAVFDDAALALARKLVFRPALRGRRAVSSRLPYTMIFRPDVARSEPRQGAE